ncbi:hypothetical protein Tco_1564748 [Tanacetum coccineum]
MLLFVIKKGAENLTADHLSRLENPHQNDLEKKEITETFPLETLGMVTFRGADNSPWFVNFANYHAGNFVIKGMSSLQKRKFFKEVKRGDIMVQISPPKRSLMSVSSGPQFTKMPTSWLKTATRASVKEKFHNVMRCLKIPSKFVKYLTFGVLTSWGHSRLQNGLKRKRSPPTTPELFANFSNLSSPDSVPLVQS